MSKYEEALSFPRTKERRALIVKWLQTILNDEALIDCMALIGEVRVKKTLDDGTKVLLQVIPNHTLRPSPGYVRRLKSGEEGPANPWEDLAKCAPDTIAAVMGAPLPCTCAKIQAADPKRHFRECPMRAVYPEPATPRPALNERPKSIAWTCREPGASGMCLHGTCHPDNFKPDLEPLLNLSNSLTIDPKVQLHYSMLLELLSPSG
jgi:hypothetical protein